MGESGTRRNPLGTRVLKWLSSTPEAKFWLTFEAGTRRNPLWNPPVLRQVLDQSANCKIIRLSIYNIKLKDRMRAEVQAPDIVGACGSYGF